MATLALAKSSQGGEKPASTGGVLASALVQKAQDHVASAQAKQQEELAKDQEAKLATMLYPPGKLLRACLDERLDDPEVRQGIVTAVVRQGLQS